MIAQNARQVTCHYYQVLPSSRGRVVLWPSWLMVSWCRQLKSWLANRYSDRNGHLQNRPSLFFRSQEDETYRTVARPVAYFSPFTRSITSFTSPVNVFDDVSGSTSSRVGWVYQL